MPHVTSPDGTPLAYEIHGSGPPVVLVAGALGGRDTWSDLVRHLDGVTAVPYDRRARGHSGDSSVRDGRVPVAGAVDRELADLSALITEVGGQATLVGYSSGSQLTVLAALADPRVRGLVLYEPPFSDADEHERGTSGVRGGGDMGPDADEHEHTPMPDLLADLIARRRRDDAVRVFLAEVVGLPAEMVAGIAGSPDFPAMTRDAGSLVYDAALQAAHPTVTPMANRIRVPTAVVRGRDTWPFLRTAAEATAGAIPGAELRVIDGADHGMVPEAFAPEVDHLLGRVREAS
ncbi:alpha/beta fold hydrolase [Georgenia deserti]|uniref:Alpha/beta fold hydrolase n=1 Tax=Georgenia deserti TaxID=2093781 RepID=A0ABW4L3Z2_9MICO